MLSVGIDWARAAMIAARSRAFASGSGSPILVATVISRLSLEKRAERFLSCAPFRYMMFLNLECPAMPTPKKDFLATRQDPRTSLRQAERLAIGLEQRVGFLAGVGFHLPQADDCSHRLGVVAVGLGLGIDVADVVSDALFLLLQTLDSLDEQPQLVGRDGAFRHAPKSPMQDVWSAALAP